MRETQETTKSIVTEPKDSRSWKDRLGINTLRKFFSQLVTFLKDVANDPRIPERDKTVLLVLIGLIISPFDIIPDFIPVIGVLDDVVLLAIVLDYFFEVLDQEIILSHYPWDMKSFVRIKQASRLVSHLTPQIVKDKIWQFEGSPYKG